MTVTRDVLRLLAVVHGRRGGVSLGEMARLAHRSPFSLHRAFLRTVGETPKAFTMRVRLARAAGELLATERSAAQVAVAHGFASQAVFTRAFRRGFGVAPRVYRRRGLHVQGRAAAARHAAVAAQVAPCVGLYMMSTSTKGSAVSVEVTVDVVDMPEIHALVMRRRTGRSGIAAALGDCLPPVFAFAQREGLAMTGPPFARYTEAGLASVVLEGGVPIAAAPAVALDDGIEAISISAGPAAVVVHAGAYEGLPETYRRIEVWMEEHGREPAGPVWESYLTDPGEYPDPADWRTQVVQPLA
ncbi:helix-turn-helix domain-containing protein [Dactylosporangium sp. NPDC051541]|uniref:helix-turn-helix domain-containing protein n=1 Tax=Dactylosporangium sp. NPDC051541 TaxID=3363977 RepID=UPI0037B33C7A